MYAIFEAKGKQWRAEEGATLELPSLDAEPGDRVEFDRVLLAERDGEVLVGRPRLENASVAVEVTEHGKGDKIIVFKRKRRKNYRRKYGHRQPYTEVRVVELDLADATAPLPVEEEDGEPDAAPAAEAGEEEEAAGAAPDAGEEPDTAPEEDAPEAEAEIDVTDAARELAEEHGIDLTGLEGTGKEGRILKSDVQGAVDAAGDEPTEEDGAPGADAAAEEEGATVPDDLDITDAARELAEEHAVDVTAVDGTGKDGRVLKSDVQQAIEEREEE